MGYDLHSKRLLWLLYGEKEEARSWLGAFFGSPGKQEMAVKIAKCQQVMSLEISSSGFDGCD